MEPVTHLTGLTDPILHPRRIVRPCGKTMPLIKRTFAASASGAHEIGDNAHLDELDVHPAHGQRGLGTALVEAVCDWAKASGYRAITLTTLRHIPWNARWYERLGFRVLEEHELSAALRELLREEIQRGLPAEQRVAMRREL